MDEATGELELTFDHADDFSRHFVSTPEPGVKVQRILFSEPIELTAKGSRGTGENPGIAVFRDDELILCMIEDEITLVSADGDRQVIPFRRERDEQPEFELTLSIADGQAELREGARVLCAASVARPCSGFLLVRGIRALTSVRIRGRYLGFMDRLPDAELRDDSLARGSIPRELPVVASRGFAFSCDPIAPAVFQQRWFDALERVSPTAPLDVRRCEQLLDGPLASGLSAETRLRLRADMAWIAGSFEDARAGYEHAAAVNPRCLELRRVDLCAHLGVASTDVLRSKAERLVADFPDEPAILPAAALAFYESGAPERASDLVRRARTMGLQTPTIEALSRAVVAYEHGPAWRSARRATTASTSIVAGDDRDLLGFLVPITATENWLQDAFGQSTKPACKVLLFSFPAEFDRHTNDLSVRQPSSGHPPEIAGYFIPGPNQILVRRAKDDSQTVRSIRHEMAHAWVHASGARIPSWLNEAFAMRVENLEEVDGQLRPSRTHRRWRDALRASGVRDLRQFLSQSPEAFYSNIDTHYAMGAVLLDYLEQGTPPERGAFDRLLAAVVAGEHAPSLAASAFEGIDLDQLRTAMSAWLTKQD